MKIGIVCYPTYGGSGVVATELGIALAGKGHKVHFITYRQPVRLDHFGENLFFHEVRPNNYPLFEFPPYELTLISKMIEVCKFEKLDVLHVHYAIPHAFSAYNAQSILLEQGISIPVITTLHGTDVTLIGKNATLEPVVSHSMAKSTMLTAVSEYLKDETYRTFNIDKPIEVIPNFINLKKFGRRQMDHFKRAIAPNEEKIIVHTSNFRKVKRIDDAIRVFAEVKKRIPAKFLMVGDGPERSRAEKMCRELEICQDVRFLGKINAVEEILSIADVFLMPSESESFGLAALEAMACECPVVSTNAGGLPEVNADGFSGLLSPVGSVEQMAQNTIDIIGDSDTHQTFRKNALAQADKFSLDKILPKYEEVYEKSLLLKPKVEMAGTTGL